MKRFPGMTGRSPAPNMMPGMLGREQESKHADEGVLPRSKQTVLDRSGVNARSNPSPPLISPFIRSCDSLFNLGSSE